MRNAPEPDPTIDQIKGANMLFDFLKRNNCAAMTRGGDLFVVGELDKAWRYRPAEESDEIIMPVFENDDWEGFDRQFRAAVRNIAILQKKVRSEKVYKYKRGPRI